MPGRAYQTLLSGINDAHEQKADRKPCLRVLKIECTERDNPGLLYRRNACDTHNRLNAKQQKVHGEIDARDNKLGKIIQQLLSCDAKHPTLFTTVISIEAIQ